ncbi:MAG TPA: hypothetical protein VI636_01675 [Candidatus Angelobacter sp.]
MNSRKYLIAILLSVLALLPGIAFAGDAPRSATAQGPAPIPFGPAGNDVTTSLGSFKIQVVSQFASLMSACPNYDPTTRILSSPTLFDPATIIGRSDPSLAGHDIANTPFEVGAVNVGFAGIVINKDRLLPPPTYPCFTDNPSTPMQPPDHGPCASGPGTRKVDTELRSLKMSNLPGASGLAITVRAGMHYSEDPFQPTPFADIMTSPGKVQSRSGPSNDPTRDFPATSFFNVYVKVDLPPNYCGPGFPGVTLYNQDPLKVVNKMLTQFPPRVVYLHDASSIVPILFLVDGPPGPNGPMWHRGDVLGYFLLAGHGVGFGSSQSDVTQFQNFMSTQSNAACPIK